MYAYIVLCARNKRLVSANAYDFLDVLSYLSILQENWTREGLKELQDNVVLKLSA